MILKNISLINFRNYINTTLCFSDKINAIIAENGKGKTNLLESIYYCSYLRSFRLTNDKNLKNNNANFFFISINYEIDKLINNIKIHFNNKEKNILFNEKKIRKHSELLGKFLTIIFSPDDINIIKGPQIIKRKYFNSFYSILDYEYLDLLKKYNEVIKQKNFCLKSERVDLLETYDIQIIEITKKIYEKRTYFTNLISNYFYDFFNVYQNKKVNTKIVYKPFVDEKIIINNNLFMDHLKKYNEYDKKRGFTTIGLHKDCFYFIIDNYNFENYASLGQCRLASLNVKLVQKKIFEEYLKRKPILLLDDVMMELDEKRKHIFLNSLNCGNQIFLTLTTEKNLEYFENNDINRIYL